MNPLALIWNNYLRWRHSKGFGVHSPFAYNLVTTVVRPGIYGYYGYDDIESAIYEETDNPDGDPALENDARLLLRLAVCLKTERLVLMRCGNKPFEAAAKGAGIHCLKIAGASDFSAKPGDMVVLADESGSPEEVASLLKAGAAVTGFDSPINNLSATAQSQGYGLLLTGKRVFIAIPNKGMAFVEYSMRF